MIFYGHTDTVLLNKIPQNFIRMIKENRNKEYITNIDYNKKLIEQDILHDTKVMLGVIYRNYFLENNFEKEKFDYNELFKNKTNNQNIKNNTSQNTAMIEYKENPIVRFFYKIKKFYFINSLFCWIRNLALVKKIEMMNFIHH